MIVRVTKHETESLVSLIEIRDATVFRGSGHGFLAGIARVLFRRAFRRSLYLLIVGRLTV